MNGRTESHVLKYFGKAERDAKREYRKDVKSGIDEGKRSDLVGGGLIRSLCRWSQVKSLRALGEKEMSDARILGNGNFVEQLLKETDEVTKQYLPAYDKDKKIKKWYYY